MTVMSGSGGDGQSQQREPISGVTDHFVTQKVGGVLALMISHGSVPRLRNRCGTALLK